MKVIILILRIQYVFSIIATSALDYECEKAVQEALNRAAEGIL